MRKLLIFLNFFTFIFSYSQKNIHLEYIYVRSPIATVKEDLYTDGNNVLSKQDENINFTNSDRVYTKKFKAIYFISKLKESNKGKDFFFNYFLEGKGDYFVHDFIPQIQWNIDKSNTKKILGYNCVKATAIFRGSNITAYFTDEIPFGIGPFKFYGLPGVILDVREDGQSYNIWKAVKVDLNNKSVVNYTPDFKNSIKIPIKDFVKLQDEANVYRGNKAVVEGSTSHSISVRLNLEKKYEWEK